MKIGDLPILPAQASTTAASVDWVALAVLSVCLFFAVSVLIVMVTFLIRYREGSLVDRSNPPLGKDWLEWTWIAIPTLLSLGLFWGGARTYLQLYRMPLDATVIDVVGKQWMWEIYYPNGRKEINNLHVQIGEKIELRMISEDVIHSFFVPDFRVKHDVLPGRYSYLWFEANQVGRFHLFCSEFCGTSHSVMGGFVEVLSPEDYRQWLDNQPTAVPQSGDISRQGATPAERGRALFEKVGCAGCHEGLQVPAPRLQGLYGRNVTLADNTTVVADEQYLRDSILYPQKQIVAGFGEIMPTYDHRLNEAQILDLIAYLRSLGGAP